MSDKPDLSWIKDIISHPATSVFYFSAVSEYNETISESISLHYEPSYEQNVSLTGAALLDGYDRHQTLNSEKSSSEFISDVLADMKDRSENKVPLNTSSQSNEES
mgnify:CR=1 FL=1|jgi:hypothetical protein